MGFLILAGTDLLTTADDVADRWDLFTDRFADGEVDYSIPLEVPYGIEVVKDWLTLDRCIALMQEMGLQLPAVESNGTVFRLARMEQICRFMSPRDESWRLFCVIGDADKLTSYRDLGRVVRSGNRPEYAQRRLEGGYVHSNLNLYFDPVYDSTGDDRVTLLDVDWLNAITGAIHSAWCEHGSGTGEVDVTRINWHHMNEISCDSHTLFQPVFKELINGELSVAEATKLITTAEVECFSSIGSTLAFYYLEEAWNRKSTGELDLSKYSAHQLTYMYNLACGDAELRWSWNRRRTLGTRNRTVLFGIRVDGYSNYLDMRYMTSLMYSCGLDALVNLDRHHRTNVAMYNNNDMVTDLFGYYNRIVIGRWSHGRGSPNQSHVAAGKIRILIQDIIDSLGTMTLNVLVAVLLIYWLSARHNHLWYYNSILAKFMQIACNRLEKSQLLQCKRVPDI